MLKIKKFAIYKVKPIFPPWLLATLWPPIRVRHLMMAYYCSACKSQTENVFGLNLTHFKVSVISAQVFSSSFKWSHFCIRSILINLTHLCRYKMILFLHATLLVYILEILFLANWGRVSHSLAVQDIFYSLNLSFCQELRVG